MTRHPRTLTLLLALSLAAPAAAESAYDAAFAESRRLEAEGRPADAARALEPLTQDYDQDYALWLRLGWLRFEAEAYPEAEAAYRRAMALSGGAQDARLGLAWTLLREGRRAAAAEGFRAILADDPAQASAQEGLALATVPAVSFAPHLSVSVFAEGGASSGTWVGGLAGLDALVRGHVLFGAAVRSADLGGSLAGGRGRGMNAGTATTGDLEAHLRAGWVTEPFGLIALGAFVTSSDGYGPARPLGSAWIAGLSGRWSPFGDGVLEASWSAWPDVSILRLAPSWRLPVVAGLSVTPGLAVQHLVAPAGAGLPPPLAEAVGAWPVAGSLGLRYDGSGFSLWAGGKLGDEVRPAYLWQPSVWGITATFRGGGWAGGDLALGGGWALYAAWEGHALLEPSQPDVLSVLPIRRDTFESVFTFGVRRTP